MLLLEGTRPWKWPLSERRAFCSTDLWLVVTSSTNYHNRLFSPGSKYHCVYSLFRLVCLTRSGFLYFLKTALIRWTSRQNGAPQIGYIAAGVWTSKNDRWRWWWRHAWAADWLQSGKTTLRYSAAGKHFLRFCRISISLLYLKKHNSKTRLVKQDRNEAQAKIKKKRSALF